MKELPVIFQEVEVLQKAFLKKDRQLLDRPFYPLVSFIKNFISQENQISEIVLELLMRISRMLYLKTQFILSSLSQKEEEEEEDWVEPQRISPVATYLPTERLLWEKVFLPEPSYKFLEELGDIEIGNKGDLMQLLKALLRVLETEKTLQEVIERGPQNSIEDYIEKIQELLNTRGSFTFEEVISELDFSCREALIEVVYYFLAVLFLCFQGLCSVVQQREFGDIQIFKNT